MSHEASGPLLETARRGFVVVNDRAVQTSMTWRAAKTRSYRNPYPSANSFIHWFLQSQFIFRLFSFQTPVGQVPHPDPELKFPLTKTTSAAAYLLQVNYILMPISVKSLLSNVNRIPTQLSKQQLCPPCIRQQMDR